MALCLFAAATAQAFDSAEWHGKREVLLREAERLQAAYSNCLASAQEPAEDIKVPVETFADGSVKTVVAAKRARFFMHTGLSSLNLPSTGLAADCPKRIFQQLRRF